MYKGTIKLGVVAMVIGLFTSCKMNAQNTNDRQERKEPPTVAQIFKELDKDEDGKISKKEVKGPLKNDFAKIDTDEDGFITKEELKKAPKPERGEGRQQRGQ